MGAMAVSEQAERRALPRFDSRELEIWLRPRGRLARHSGLVQDFNRHGFSIIVEHAIAKDVGLDYVYIGNVHGHPTESTFCPTCGRVMIKRYGYSVQEYNLQPGGYCPFDGTRIPGIWL